MKENYFENPQKEIEVFVEDITNITKILRKVKKIIRENQALESEIDIFVQDDENLNMKIKCLFKEEKIFFYFPAFYDLGEWDKKSLDFKDFLESIDYEAVIYLADAEAFMTKDSLKVRDDTYRHFEYDSLQFILRNMRYDKFSNFSYSSQNCNLETIKCDEKTSIKNFWAFHNFSFINKDKKTAVIKGSNDTVKYLSLYILEKYRNKNIKTIGKEEINEILFIANLNHYKDKSEFLFDSQFMLIDGIHQFLDVYNLFCNIYGKTDIKDIERTNEIIIDDVFKMKKEIIKKYEKKFKIENEAKEKIDEVVELYTDIDEKVKVARDIFDFLFRITFLEIAKKFPVFKNENLKEIMDQEII